MTNSRLFFLKIAAACVVGLFLLDRIVIGPLGERWHDQSERVGALEAKVKRGRQLLDRQDAIRTRWADMIRANLPEEVSAAENLAYKAVGRWAADSRITFTSLTPQWQTREDDNKVLECRVSADGNQATLGRFIYELETDPLPVNLEECEITTRDGHGSQLMMSARFSFLRLEGKGK